MVTLSAPAVGPLYVSRFVGVPAVELSGANADVVLAALVALSCSGCDSENVPLTSLPVAAALESVTESVALPAVLTTVAAAAASYVRAVAGMNAPKLLGVPSVRLSVVGTVPLTPPVASAVLWPLSRMDSVALSAFETTIRRATDLVLVLVGLKPTLTKQVAFGAMAAAVQPAASRTWKSAGRSPSRTRSCEVALVLLASAMLVMV